MSVAMLDVPLFEGLDVPQILPDDAPRVRRTDPVTSSIAADATAKKLAGSQQAVLTALRERPMADHELVTAVQADAEWGKTRIYSPSRIRSARSELAEKGLVRKANFTRPTISNLPADVWEVAE